MAPLGHCHADTGEDLGRPGGQLERMGHHLLEPLGQMSVVLFGPMGDHHELVAAEAGDEVVFPDRTPQPSGQVAQQFVTGAMTEKIVDRLEAIQIDERHAQLVLAPGGTAQRFGKVRVEGGPIGQPGEAVAIGELLELVLHDPQTGDVMTGDHEPVDRGIVEQIHDRQLERRRPLAVPMAEPHLDRARADIDLRCLFR